MCICMYMTMDTETVTSHYIIGYSIYVSLLYDLGLCINYRMHAHTHTHTHPPSHYQDELAPNVMAMVQSFNRLALLVPTEILEEKTPQARSKVITSFIQVRKFRFHSQFTVLHSHARLNLILIPFPEETSNLIGHFTK